VSLSNEDIQRLLAKKEPAKTSKGRSIDTSRREVDVWFKLQQKLYDEEKEEMAKCSNPDCTDHRGRAQLVATVNSTLMCRRCFLAGYKLEIEV
jgi:hypothetical protein